MWPPQRSQFTFSCITAMSVCHFRVNALHHDDILCHNWGWFSDSQTIWWISLLFLMLGRIHLSREILSWISKTYSRHIQMHPKNDCVVHYEAMTRTEFFSNFLKLTYGDRVILFHLLLLQFFFSAGMQG